MAGEQSPLTLDTAHEHEVQCYCGSSRVTSRMPRWYDKYTVCSRGCFDKMSTETDYYTVLFKGKNER